MPKQQDILTLSENDPRVIAAREAEERLFAHYGLEPKIHYIPLGDSGMRVRVVRLEVDNLF